MDPSNDILIVDDHPTLLNSLRMTLESADFATLTATNGKEAISSLKTNNVSLILADIAMPVMNGYQLYEAVRQNPLWANIPFIFLTARSLETDVRFGKELGVDDYLVKPIEPEDLLAVVKGKLKRAQQLRASFGKSPFSNGATFSSYSHLLQYGNFRINIGQHQAWQAGNTCSLSVKEFRLLECLVRNGGKLVSTEELLTHTHGFEAPYTESSSLIRPLIRTLRQKLDLSKEGDHIQTIRGVGYRLVSQE